ncbi:MAG: hypothetical protein P8X96_12030 [Desulfobacteraceae bacterium]
MDSGGRLGWDGQYHRGSMCAAEIGAIASNTPHKVDVQTDCITTTEIHISAIVAQGQTGLTL